MTHAIPDSIWTLAEAQALEDALEIFDDADFDLLHDDVPEGRIERVPDDDGRATRRRR